MSPFGNIKIHQAVCEAFHGPKPFPRAVVIHLDEDAHNNRPENLKWGTQKENLNMPKFKAWQRSPERCAAIKEGKRKAAQQRKVG
ncbi:HNH endonuclease signature motif containing protein [Sphingobium sp. B1D7B]|uniref:HNH endonuclease signature motif containing protein n=1 Tax=Sphingobium sp. B1D7B TaxID=2940578 RepID=UPI0039B4DC57